MHIKDLFESEFDIKTTTFLTHQVLKATTAFNILMSDNRDFFSYPLYSSVKGTLLNYSIEHCIYDAAFTSNVHCRVYQKDVNRFKRSILHLETDHFLMTTAKTNHANDLPSASNYKREYASHNRGQDGQLSFDFDKNAVSEPPYYVLLTYGYNTQKQECSHINLLVPDADFKGFICEKNIMSQSNTLEISPKSQEIEETIAKLKPGFQKEIMKATK